MPAFQINDEEWGALSEEPGDIFLAYCAIRRFMDYKTGIAGASRRLSEQMMREVLYVAPTQGRHVSGSPTRQRVRSVLDRLVKLGVLIPLGAMIYRLPLATYLAASKTSATNEQPVQKPYQQPEHNQPEPRNNGAYEDIKTPSPTATESGCTENSNLPQISGKANTHTQRAREDFASSERFPMPDTWVPDPQSFHAVLVRNGMGNVRYLPDQLLEFRSYWVVHPERHQTQAQWEHQFAQQLRRINRNQQTQGTGHEVRERPPVKRVRNAIDILNDDDW